MEGPVGVVLVVPCRNEAANISACLTAAFASPLPAGMVWDRWFVVDDASTDATSAVVRRWAQQHQEVSVCLVENSVRMGKAASLEAIRSHIGHTGRRSLIVVIDADGRVGRDALALLLAPFVQDQAMAVVWGWHIPLGPRRHCLASRFQLVLT